MEGSGVIASNINMQGQDETFRSRPQRLLALTQDASQRLVGGGSRPAVATALARTRRRAGRARRAGERARAGEREGERPAARWP